MRFLRTTKRLINIDRIDYIDINRVAYEDDKYTITLVQNKFSHILEGNAITIDVVKLFIKNLILVKDGEIADGSTLLYGAA